MPTYNVAGWIWAGLGTPTTLSLVTLADDDATLSPYFTNDFTETLTIGGTTYTNPRAGTYNLTFTDSGGTSHNEDFLLFYTGSNFVFVPLPGSAFDNGSIVTALGGWQQYTTGFTWSNVMCFAGGTLIQTPDGPKAVETIGEGDRVITRDHGAQRVKWIGSSSVDFASLSPERAAKLRPIRISQGALGPDLPARDLLVSPQHRILAKSAICARMFGDECALVAARNLVALPGVFRDDQVQRVDYHHLLFEHHEIIYAECLAAESLLTGPMALQSVGPEARAEILTLFPQLADADHQPPAAAHVPRSGRQRRLVARHLKNDKPLAPQNINPAANVPFS